MGQEDDLNTSIAHIVLCCVAGNGIGHMRSQSWTDPGMHANFFIHGVLGFLHYQSSVLNNDFAPAYAISLKATKYLALPCLMADMWRISDKNLSFLHLVSGLIPFALALGGKDNPELGHLVVALNIVSLGYYSHKYHRDWGWYTAGAAIATYFCIHKAPKVLYPLGLALTEYCAYRVWHISHSSASSME